MESPSASAELSFFLQVVHLARLYKNCARTFSGEVCVSIAFKASGGGILARRLCLECVLLLLLLVEYSLDNCLLSV